MWEFQNEQIADASLVVLNKCDLLQEDERDICLGALRAGRHNARIIETAYGEMPPEIVTGAGLSARAGFGG